MCDDCGCGQPPEAVTYRKPGEVGHHHGEGHPHDHHHHEHGPGHDHAHPHDHHGHDHHHHHDAAPGSRTLQVETDVLAQNNLLAERNRGWFDAKGILALNLVSSPGSGKTTLLERTITDLKGDLPFVVIEGDQQTLNDADRIAATGAPVIQVNTGKGCHLDAQMILRACRHLEPAQGSVLMIENVGNLVCPAMFDLGEAAKVVIISVTEGDDKPLKYPTMFAASDLCLINKIDLLPYVNFDVDACEEAARRVNPRLEFRRVSATTGEGLDGWYDWLRNRRIP
jgi:hydrogenase nickel incorporation protein HypB